MPNRATFRGPSSWGGGGTGGGGGGGAPTDGPYVTTAASGSLSAETLIGAIILPQDTIANRPAATAVVAGALYFPTDEPGKVYRSNATTWTELLNQRTLNDGEGTTVNTGTAGQVKIDTNPTQVDDFITAGSTSSVPPLWVTSETMVTFKVKGAGGGGASGRRGAAASIRGGGGGGADGNYSEVSMPFGSITLSAGNIAVVVGAGGAGGALNTTNDTNGAVGTAGGTSSAGLVVAAGGGGGAAGTGTDGGVGGTPGTRGRFRGNAGAKGGGVAAAEDISAQGLLGSGVNSSASGGGGGGGRGRDAANTEMGPSAGGPVNAYTAGTAGGAAGVYVTTNPVAGATVTEFLATGGGGGSGSGAGGVGMGGAAGGFPGGGGGGGGSANNGLGAGAGGTGGDGRVQVIYEAR